MAASLDGQVILNTRPAHQQEALTARLEAEGARVLSFPAIEIELAEPGPAQRRIAAGIEAFDILLFVSRNAVDGAFTWLDPQRLAPSQRFGVIGSATRDALLAAIGDPGSRLIESEPYNSEALLEVDALRAVDGKRVLIFRGQQGRNLLGDELERRGARVEYLEVYRRELPRVDADAFASLVEAGFPTLAVLTSNEGMHNLLRLVDAASRERLCAIPWLLISERMRESAQELGHNAAIVIARSASDSGIFDTITAWAGGQQNEL